uniref:PD-(D/E)XK endonuclease-like domain-containing protein n=1 Tax=viral metagenome TaxID=1070528 RepID=A0A6C0IM20_9ZZZZ
MDFLAKKNKHDRDLNISFEAGPHLYTIKGAEGKKFTSVTTWNHSHFAEFDADLIITNMMKGKNWLKSKYYGQTREEIKAGWDKGRDEAADEGTNMHYQIECYYNTGEHNAAVNVIAPSIEYTYFQNFLAACAHLKPYRTEWMIYHEELSLAGSIDMVYENPDGTLMIYDWKRAKDIKKADAFGKNAITDCISHIPDTNFWHYALQLNTYKTILEEKYGKTVTKLALVCLHPAKKNFEVIPVPILKDEMTALFALRRGQIL